MNDGDQGLSDAEEEPYISPDDVGGHHLQCDWSSFEDSSGDEEPERCGLCYGRKAVIPCQSCNREFYCKEMHRTLHKDHHARVCEPQTEVGAPLVLEEDTPIQVQEDSPLLTLPTEILLLICQRMVDPRTLLRVSQTCRALRLLARDPRAWQSVKCSSSCFNVILPKIEGEFDETRFFQTVETIMSRPASMRLLRYVPALHSLEVDPMWPPTNLMRCTKNVRVFNMDCSRHRFSSDDEDDEYEDFISGPFEMMDSWKLYRLLRHFKGNLQVVRLRSLRNGCLLKAIDRLDIKELYLDGQLVKAYPGSRKEVTSLKVGESLDGRMLAHVLRGCSHSLLSFRMWPSNAHMVSWAAFMNDSWYFHDRSWKSYSGPAVYRALQGCSRLQDLRAPTWGNVSLLGSFPELRKLSLCAFGAKEHHGRARRFLRSTAALRRVETLTLRMGYFVHRGLLGPLAGACPNTRFLRLIFSQGTEQSGFTVTVDLPRDLLSVVGLMGDLERLEVYWARVPSTVFAGLAKGQLPNLRHLKLSGCGVTPKARAALESLRASRPDLEVAVDRLKTAARDWDQKTHQGPYWVSVPERCQRAACDVDSDAEEEDPVTGDFLDGDLEGQMDIYDDNNVQPLWSGRDPSDAEEDAAEAEEDVDNENVDEEDEDEYDDNDDVDGAEEEVYDDDDDVGDDGEGDEGDDKVLGSDSEDADDERDPQDPAGGGDVVSEPTAKKV